MTLRRAALYTGGASLLVAWFSSAASLPTPRTNDRIAAEMEQSASSVELAAAQVQHQSKRLRDRLASIPAPPPPGRNPFAFHETAPRRELSVASGVKPIVTPSAPVEPPEPLLKLIGVAEHKREHGLVRTALIVTAGEDLLMVTTGESVIQRYTVSTISADAVELTNVTSGATRRLVLEAP